MKLRDRIAGIALGLVAGLAIVTAFVFLGSAQTIDAPGLARGQPTGTKQPSVKRPPRPRPQKPAGGSRTTPPAKVQVIGGAPPPSGPAHLDYARGDRVRLVVTADGTVGLELLGYGISRTVAAGQPAEIDFTASKTGNFPLIVAASHIAVAQIRVGG